METMKLYQSLAKFRQDATISKSGKNPMFKSEYTTLGDVLSALHNLPDYGLTFSQFFANDLLVTEVIHLETGEKALSQIVIKPEKDTPQAFMSCVTYYRRASLMTMFGLNADDDDGNRASNSGAGWNSPSSPAAAKAPAGDVSSVTPAGAAPTDEQLAAALAACNSVKEVNAVYMRLFKTKGVEPNDSQLAKLKTRKAELNV